MGKHVREIAVSNTYAPTPLPQIKSLSERREITRAHAGLCGVHNVGDISIIFPCSFAVGITQQYGIYVLLG